jgi:hypothetical protein
MRGWVIVIWLVGQTSCQEALVGNQFKGEPLILLEGTIYADEPYSGPVNLRLAPFWSVSGATQINLSQLLEQVGNGFVAKVPAAFRMPLFYAPDESQFVESSPGFGVALLLAYDDFDGDKLLGRWGSFSELAGVSSRQVLLYVPSAIEKEVSPLGGAIPAGFHVLSIPAPCSKADWLEPGEQECHVPLGAPCQSKAECGTLGTCLTSVYNTHLSKGTCALSVNNAGGCMPKNGVALRLPEVAWFETCSIPSGCTREGYSCQAIDGVNITCNVCVPADNFDTASFFCRQLITNGTHGCGLQLGQPCLEDRQCSDPFMTPMMDLGRCLMDIPGLAVFPEGYCTLFDPLGGCPPSNGALLEYPNFYWHQSCASNHDCPAANNPICHPLYKACLPKSTFNIQVEQERIYLPSIMPEFCL